MTSPDRIGGELELQGNAGRAPRSIPLYDQVRSHL